MTISNQSPFEEAIKTIDDLMIEVSNWCDGCKIENEQQHDAVTELYKKVHEAGKNCEDLRVKEKKPFDEAAKEIQERYNPYVANKTGKVDIAKSSLNQLLAKYRKEQQAKIQKEAEEARLKAEKIAAEAEEKRRESFGDIEAKQESIQQEKEAKALQKEASKLETKAKKGLRKFYKLELNDLNAARNYFWQKDKSRFVDLIMKMAQEELNSGKRSIEGFNVIEEERAV